MPDAHPFADATLISCYSRADALADGVLIDLSTIGQEAGLRFPVAITRAAWEAWIGWTDDDTKRQTYQDEAGRAWDVVHMLAVKLRAVTRSRPNDSNSRVEFQFYAVPRGGRGTRPRLTTLKCFCGPGDDAEPVLTILTLTED